MKVVLLLAHSGQERLEKCKEQIQIVLEELDVRVESIDLHGLPYYKTDQMSPVAALIAEKIADSKGVIVLTSAHIGGMHGTMQSFLEHFTRYPQAVVNKPLLTVIDTSYRGERQVAYQVLQAWETLGGVDGGSVCMHTQSMMADVLGHMERSVEAYYRMLKQERTSMPTSDYYFYHDKQPLRGAVSHSVEVPVEEVQQQPPTSHIDLSTKEQNIHELTQLLKQQIAPTETSQFVEMPKRTYDKPAPQVVQPVVSVATKVSNIPHYFIAQHDKQFQAVIQYVITDTDETGVIRISNGDCIYENGTTQDAHVEMILSQEILEQIINKQLTYQKAFMIGKLKAKGNFGILGKLDQVFK